MTPGSLRFTCPFFNWLMSEAGSASTSTFSPTARAVLGLTSGPTPPNLLPSIACEGVMNRPRTLDRQKSRIERRAGHGLARCLHFRQSCRLKQDVWLGLLRSCPDTYAKSATLPTANAANIIKLPYFIAPCLRAELRRTPDNAVSLAMSPNDCRCSALFAALHSASVLLSPTGCEGYSHAAGQGLYSSATGPPFAIAMRRKVCNRSGILQSLFWKGFS